jgi:hypothetical protein
MIGSIEQKQFARLRMQELISLSTGPQSADNFFKGSLLRTTLWSKLLINASNEASARRILSARSALDIRLGIDGKITLDLAKISLEDYSNTPLEVLEKELELEFAPAHLPLQILSSRIEARDLSSITERARNALLPIRSSGRQEDRIALLIKEILLDRTIGLEVLGKYTSDRATFANRGLRNIKLATRDYSPQAGQAIMAAQIDQMIQSVFALNKGYLLFSLSKHLADYPTIRQVIKNATLKSAARNVIEQRSNIFDNLSVVR